MAITWSPALDKVENIVGSAVAGGSFEASTTYYIRICASDYNNYGKSDGIRRSEVSDLVTITTDATNKTLQLDWDAVTDAVCYNVYVYTDDSNWHLSRLQAVTTNSATITSAPTTTYLRDTFAFNGNTPIGFDKNLGEGIIQVDGDEGAFDLDDLVAVVPSAYVTYDGANLFLKGSINIQHTASGTWYEVYKTITTWHGRIYNHVSSDVVCTFIDCTFYITHWSYHFGIYHSTLTRCRIIGDTRWGSTSTIIGGDYYADHLGGDYEMIDGGGNYYDLVVFAVKPSYNLSGGIVKASGMIVQSDDSTLEDSSIENNFGAYGRFDDLSNLIMRNLTFGGATYDIRFAYTWATDTYNFRDCTFTRRSNNIPVVGYTGSSEDNYTNKVDIYNSLALTVLDRNGDPVEGATVLLVNTDDVEAINDTTDSNGQITATDCKRARVEHLEGGSYIENLVTTYSPFTLTISKDGYTTYISEFDITDKTELIVTLSTAIAVNDPTPVFYNPHVFNR